MQIILTVIGILISVWSTTLYVKGILQKKIKPHFYTYLVFSIVTVITFFGAAIYGGGIGNLIVGSFALLTIPVAMLSLKYGTKDITFSDKIFLAGALVAIVPWLFLKDPYWSVILAVCTDFFAYLPTVRKTWKSPKTEIAFPWFLGALRSLLALFALDQINLITTLFPLEILVMNSFVTFIILFKKSR